MTKYFSMSSKILYTWSKYFMNILLSSCFLLIVHTFTLYQCWHWYEVGIASSHTNLISYLIQISIYILGFQYLTPKTSIDHTKIFNLLMWNQKWWWQKSHKSMPHSLVPYNFFKNMYHNNINLHSIVLKVTWTSYAP
jgi:hypothetical protein